MLGYEPSILLHIALPHRTGNTPIFREFLVGQVRRMRKRRSSTSENAVKRKSNFLEFTF